ncbi:MAG: hypothetical protein ACYTG1_01645 [Planctomycetota bacterium]
MTPIVVVMSRASKSMPDPVSTGSATPPIESPALSSGSREKSKNSTRLCVLPPWVSVMPPIQ